MNDDSEDYDVVVDTLQQKYDVLWAITKRNMNSEFIMMNIMDDIRLKQMDELLEAIEMWKSRK